MLSALDEKGRLVSLLDEISEKQTFTCPACHSPVRLRHGQIMRPLTEYGVSSVGVRC